MRMLRGVDARFLPSRHNFALFRLFAWSRLLRSSPGHATSIFVIDRHQSAAETYLIAGWIVATSACFTAEGLLDALPLPAALAVGLPVAVLLLQVLIIVGTLIIHPLLRLMSGRGPKYALRVNSVLVFVVLIAASLHFFESTSWVSLVAAQFLLLVGLNALAALILIPLKPAIERAEASLGGARSES